jgi:hypothetical protein
VSDDLDAWLARAGDELGVEASEVPADAILDVARDVAHGVVRPAAPLTAYLMGIAVGRGADPADVADKISELALSWPPPAP